MTFYCKSTCVDFCSQDSIVPRTVGKDTNCSVLWVSLATAGWSEKQLLLTLKSCFLWPGNLQGATTTAESMHSSMIIRQPLQSHFTVSKHCGCINSMEITM